MKPLLIAALLMLTAPLAHAYSSVRNYLNKPLEWYSSDEARQLANNVLSFQGPEGGWPSNTETAAKPFDGDPAKLRSTFDNSATTDELRYLARVFAATKDAKYEKPFQVRAMWHDGQFTYIKADATELPALYEVKDGKPTLLNFQVHQGTYVVPKVVDQGYLALGKERFSFSQGR